MSDEISFKVRPKYEFRIVRTWPMFTAAVLMAFVPDELTRRWIAIALSSFILSLDRVAVAVYSAKSSGGAR